MAFVSEDASGHKKMRMEPAARLQRKKPLKERRSYFDSADYFLEVQGVQQGAVGDTDALSTPTASTRPNTPSTPAQQALPMKLQPCQHVAQPSRLSMRS